jgi:cytosine permease
MKLEENQQQSWLSLAFVWAGAMISVPSLMIGGTLVGSMSLWKALLAGFIGYGLIVILMVLQGIQSTDLKKPSVKVASQVFGIQGSQKMISIILAIACLGWFGLQANVCGGAFTNFLKIYGINIPIAISSLVWGIIMLISALYGMKILKILNYLAVPVLVVVCLYGLVASLGDNGLEKVVQYTPAAEGELYDRFIFNGRLFCFRSRNCRRLFPICKNTQRCREGSCCRHSASRSFNDWCGSRF